MNDKQLDHDSEHTPTEAPFPLMNIILGIVFPAAVTLMYMFLFRSEYIRYRPWIAQHVAWAAILLQQFSLLVFYFVLCRRKNLRHLFRSLSFPKIVIEFLVAFLAAVTIFLLMGLITHAAKWAFNIEMPVDNVTRGIGFASNSYVLIVTIIAAIAIAPLCEELYVRGFLYNALKTRFPFLVAVLLQAAVFAFLHFRS